jgi:succinate dehydrogenase / fumarate reductase iron-sulfur subunit
MLACHTPIEELKKDTVTVKSLPNFPIVKDLVPDLTPLFENHKFIKPYLIQAMEEIEKPTAEFLQEQLQLEEFVQFAYCVKCGLCMAACPTVATDKHFLGPQPLAQAYRYSADRRDAGAKERFKQTDTPHGLWLCHLAGACSEACPKGVDPALAIQLLKRATLADGFRLTKKKAQPTVAASLEQKKPRVAVPEFTINKPGAKS